MNAKESLKEFPAQIRWAVDAYKPHYLNISQFSNVLIAGLGGSGIGGKLSKNWFGQDCPIPIDLLNDYDIPGYVGNNTLVLACSYSGNTEETLEVYRQAKARGATLICISTGGRLAEMAQADGTVFYQSPAGFQPRFALGYSFSFLFLIFAELLGQNLREELLEAAEGITDAAAFEQESREILSIIRDSLNRKVVVVTDQYLEGVGLRVCQQVQENAKSEAFLHVLPEANHNVIESYYGKVPSIFFFLRSDKQERVAARFDFLTSLLEVENNQVINVMLPELNIPSIIELIYRFDWLSVLMADEKHLEPLNIANINNLKEYLAGIPQN